MQKRNLLVIFLALVIFSISTNPCYAKKAKKRPTVAVVLSGGGAKGMAHIGALEVIKKVGIPIDYYVGTSMGAIIGGLSSIGYSPEQLDSMVRIQNWSMLLSDRIPRVNQNIQDRETAEKYIISVPFAMKMKLPQGGGLIKGQNLDNLFSELTIGYHDSLDFNKLPVPFACVSDNIVNGKEVNFHSGVLSQAMRASMAIPGVFTPVRMDSMVLVDGGVINNYPVNVAKAMGADYIIGIDVQSNLKPASELGTAPSILGQLINLMGEEMYKKNLKQSDVVIKVDVKGYSAASFTPEAIDTLIRRGREAGDKQIEALFELKRTLGLDSTFIPTPPNEYPYSNDRKVFVRKVIFDGYHIREKKWLLKECNLEENSEIDVRVIDQAATMLCSNMGYASATFTLPQSQEGG
ncbi:patatin-like phospholipase family protein, partial [Phocaeicola paurosaccharolyticus]|uniref:patatin-like phospholipase family protein n=1 Tax=Phocaeicola paurosaccharolyticus TaxID=732242 RepID=UPI002FE016FB